MDDTINSIVFFDLEFMSDLITVSTDKSLLNTTVIHTYLSEQSYWARGRTFEEVVRSIEHSMCFGVYLDGQQIGFARVISDKTIFAYLADVFVLPNFQGRGVAQTLLKSILDHSELKSVNWLLRTADAHSLYEKFGFVTVDEPKTYLKKLRINN